MPKWEKYEFPPSMLKVEQGTKTIGLSSEQIDQIWLTRLQTKIDLARDENSKKAWNKRKIRLEEKMARGQINDDFSKDFVKWLVGRSPWNSKERIIKAVNVDGSTLESPTTGATILKRVDGCPWGNTPLTHLPDVVNFVDQGPDRRADVIKQLTKLKMHGPRNIDEAYIYYKYILRNFGIDDNSCKELDDLMGDYDYPRDLNPDGSLKTYGPQGDTFENNGMGPGAPPLFDEATYKRNFREFYQGIFTNNIGLMQLQGNQDFHQLGAEDQDVLIQMAAGNALARMVPLVAETENPASGAGPNTAGRTDKGATQMTKKQKEAARKERRRQRREQPAAKVNYMNPQSTHMPKPVIQRVNAFDPRYNVNQRPGQGGAGASAPVAADISVWGTNELNRYYHDRAPPGYVAALAAELQKGNVDMFAEQEKLYMARFNGIEEMIRQMPTAQVPAMEEIKQNLNTLTRDFLEAQPAMQNMTAEIGKLMQMMTEGSKAVFDQPSTDLLDRNFKLMQTLENRLKVIEKTEIATMPANASQAEISQLRKEMIKRFDSLAKRREEIEEKRANELELLGGRFGNIQAKLSILMKQPPGAAATHFNMNLFDQRLEKSEKFIAGEIEKLKFTLANSPPDVQQDMKTIVGQLEKQSNDIQAVNRLITNAKRYEDRVIASEKSGETSRQNAQQELDKVALELNSLRAESAAGFKQFEALGWSFERTIEQIAQITEQQILKVAETERLKRETQLIEEVSTQTKELQLARQVENELRNRIFALEAEQRTSGDAVKINNEAQEELVLLKQKLAEQEGRGAGLESHYQREFANLQQQIGLKQTEFDTEKQKAAQQAEEIQKLQVYLQAQETPALVEAQRQIAASQARQEELQKSIAQYQEREQQFTKIREETVQQTQARMDEQQRMMQSLQEQLQNLAQQKQELSSSPLVGSSEDIAHIKEQNQKLFEQIQKLSRDYNYQRDASKAPVNEFEVLDEDALSDDAESMLDIADTYERYGFIPDPMHDLHGMTLRDFMAIAMETYKKVSTEKLLADEHILKNLWSISQQQNVKGLQSVNPGTYTMGELFSDPEAANALFGTLTRSDGRHSLKFSQIWDKNGRFYREINQANVGVQEEAGTTGFAVTFRGTKLDPDLETKPHLRDTAAMSILFKSLTENQEEGSILAYEEGMDQFLKTTKNGIHYRMVDGTTKTFNQLDAMTNRREKLPFYDREDAVKFYNLKGTLDVPSGQLPGALVHFFANDETSDAANWSRRFAFDAGSRSRELTRAMARNLVSYQQQQAEIAQRQQDLETAERWEQRKAVARDKLNSVANLATASGKVVSDMALNLRNRGQALFAGSKGVADNLVDLMKNKAWGDVLGNVVANSSSVGAQMLSRYLPSGSFDKIAALHSAMTQTTSRFTPQTQGEADVASGLGKHISEKLTEKMQTSALRLQNISARVQSGEIDEDAATVEASSDPIIKELTSLIDSDSAIANTDRTQQVQNLAELQTINNMRHLLLSVVEEITEHSRSKAMDPQQAEFVSNIQKLKAGLVSS